MAIKEIIPSKRVSDTPVLRLIKGDRDTQAVRFLIPRYSGGVDLAPLVWSINLINAANGQDYIYLGKGVADDDTVTLEWVCGQSVTAASGTATFELEGLYKKNPTDTGVVWKSGKRLITVIDCMNITPDYTPSTLTTVQDFIITVGTKVAAMETAVDGYEARIQAAVNSAVTASSKANASASSADTAALKADKSANDADSATTAAKSATASLVSALTQCNTASYNANKASATAIATSDDLKRRRDAGEFKGADGISPQISVRDIAGGHEIMITDGYSFQTFNVLNGANGNNGSNGADGYSPSVAVTNITNGHRVAITDKTGTKTFDVLNGSNGSDASVTATNIATALGYTPSKQSDLTSHTGNTTIHVTAADKARWDASQGGGIEELDLVAAMKNRTAVTNGLYKLTSAGIMCQNSVGEMGMVAYVDDIICLNQSPWGGFVLVNVSNNDSLYLDFDVTDHTDSDIIYAVMEGDTDESAILVTENKLFSETVPSDDHINALISTALNNLNGNGVSY